MNSLVLPEPLGQMSKPFNSQTACYFVLQRGETLMFSLLYNHTTIFLKNKVQCIQNITILDNRVKLQIVQ